MLDTESEMQLTGRFEHVASMRRGWQVYRAYNGIINGVVRFPQLRSFSHNGAFVPGDIDI